MRSELRLAEHSIRSGDHVIEIWYAGEFVGQIVSQTGPGVAVISKYRILASSESRESDPDISPRVLRIEIATTQRV